VTVLTASSWPSNAELIADLHTLGYIGDKDFVFDATYGLGVWWKVYRPRNLLTNDLSSEYEDVDYHYDFRRLPKSWVSSFDVVAYDPPYKLNGTPSESDERYGVHLPTTWQARNKMILDGITGCAMPLRKKGILLVKCMDQVARNAKRWQTYDCVEHAKTQGLTLVDQLVLLGSPREQPGNRPQRHSHSNFSTLLVFKKA
jgi:hypothetical protein